VNRAVKIFVSTNVSSSSSVWWMTLCARILNARGKTSVSEPIRWSQCLDHLVF
jgi:hypothetical protein